jgi:tetratricopeptide (TPR) repeat protein
VKIYIKRIISFALLMLITLSAFPQDKLTKKERKRQLQEAQASRLFIEGQRFLMQDDFDRAYFYFKKALEISPDEAAINFKIAEILLRANRVEQAMEYGMRAVESNPENKYYNLVMAEAYTKQNQPLKAAEILENLMVNTEENQNYILDLATLYLQAGEFDKGLNALNRAEEYYGMAEQLTVQKQRIYLRKNDLGSAIKEGEKLIESQPGNSQYVLNLVEILFNNGRTEQAIAIVKKSLKDYPQQPELQLAAYALYKEKGEIDTAERMISEAFSFPDLDSEIKAQTFADILQDFKTARREKLLDELEQKMLQFHPNEPAVLTVIGDRKFFSNDRESALDLYKRAIKINPANTPVLQGIITSLFEKGNDFNEIESYTIIAVDEFPEKAEFWFFDGTAKLALKKGEESVTSLLKAKEINNSKNQQLDLLINGQLGDAFHMIGKYEEAYESYEAVLKQKPDDEHVLNNYAYFLSLSKKDLEKAKSMSQQLVKRFPKNSTYLDTHAWVLFQLKEYEEAKKYMELAIENDASPSGVMWEHYGDILYHLGKQNEAISFWKKAEGDDEASEFLIKKIKDKKYYD